VQVCGIKSIAVLSRRAAVGSAEKQCCGCAHDSYLSTELESSARDGCARAAAAWLDALNKAGALWSWWYITARHAASARVDQSLLPLCKPVSAHLTCTIKVNATEVFYSGVTVIFH